MQTLGKSAFISSQPSYPFDRRDGAFVAFLSPSHVSVALMSEVKQKHPRLGRHAQSLVSHKLDAVVWVLVLLESVHLELLSESR